MYRASLTNLKVTTPFCAKTGLELRPMLKTRTEKSVAANVRKAASLMH
jgi:hypothetical protein